MFIKEYEHSTYLITSHVYLRAEGSSPLIPYVCMTYVESVVDLKP